MNFRHLLFVLLCLTPAIVEAQSFFNPDASDISSIPSGTSQSRAFLRHYRVFNIDLAGLQSAVAAAPMEFTAAARQNAQIVSLPLPDGTQEQFAIWKVNTCAPEVYQRHPDWFTFGGRSLSNSARTVRGSITVRGFRAMIFQPEHAGAALIEPVSDHQLNQVQVYDRSDVLSDPALAQLTTGLAPGVVAQAPASDGLPGVTVDDRGATIDPVQMKVYRLAVAASGEFTQTFGGTQETGFAAVVEYTNWINGIYERDMAIRLQLVAESENVVFVNPSQDPFSGGSALVFMGENPFVLNSFVGPGNYDIGHVYTIYTGVDGVAGVAGGIGNICANGTKGAGCSTYGGSPTFFVNVIGQEIGHQMGGGHTWNRCGGSPEGRTSGSAYEPGSGSTIMSYAGSCGSDNVQGYSDLYFHAGSAEEILFYCTWLAGATCVTIEETDNRAPEVTLNYTDGFYIPIRTAFELNGSATDMDGDTILYCWEEMDLGNETTLQMPEGTSPIFRTRPPGLATNRYFPRLQTILNNGFDVTEQLPTYSRDLKFRLSGRDNRTTGGGISWADVDFQATELAGPFLVTSPNTAATEWVAGAYVSVVWDVANTNAAPVNCQRVNIRLSTDGGLTWPTYLATNVINDGQQIIQAPDQITNMARVRVEAADNVFFDVSNANFRIVAPTQPGLTAGLSEDNTVICLPASYQSQVLTFGALGFSNPINLSWTGDLPAGVTLDIAPSTLNPGETATLTLNAEAFNEADDLYITVIAAAAGADTIYLPLHIETRGNDFATFALNQPADGATGLSQNQILRWNGADDAQYYDVQLATSPSFEISTLVATKTATEVDTFKVPFLLEKNTAHYWRVRPVNTCSPHPWSEPFFFSTLSESCQSISASDLPRNISANGNNVIVESKITVNSGVTLSDVNIKTIEGSHDYFSDLEARLIAPSGTEIILFSHRCSNFNGPFEFGVDDSAPTSFSCPPSNEGAFVRPQQQLAQLIGQNSTGVWTLRLRDTESSSGGVLEDFQLDFCSSYSQNSPYIVNNNALSVESGTNLAISNSFLQVDDNDNTHDQLTFTLVTIPQFGHLELNWGGPLQPGAQFTQADIDNGALRYFDWGYSGALDCFRFVVNDGAGGFLGTPAFCIQPVGVSVEDQFDNRLDFELFPNPAHRQVLLSLPNAGDLDMELSVTDMTGRMAYQQTIRRGVEKIWLSLPALSRGVYIVSLKSGNGAGVRKLVIE